jgi:hypothetical protein
LKQKDDALEEALWVASVSEERKNMLMAIAERIIKNEKPDLVQQMYQDKNRRSITLPLSGMVNA